MPVNDEVLHCRVGSGSAPHPGVTVLPAVGPQGSGAEGCGQGRRSRGARRGAPTPSFGPPTARCIPPDARTRPSTTPPHSHSNGRIYTGVPSVERVGFSSGGPYQMSPTFFSASSVHCIPNGGPAPDKKETQSLCVTDRESVPAGTELPTRGGGRGRRQGKEGALGLGDTTSRLTFTPVPRAHRGGGGGRAPRHCPRPPMGWSPAPSRTAFLVSLGPRFQGTRVEPSIGPQRSLHKLLHQESGGGMPGARPWVSTQSVRSPDRTPATACWGPPPSSPSQRSHTAPPPHPVAPWPRGP